MIEYQTIDVPIRGMDCADCARHVQGAIAALPGVRSVDVLLSAEKAVVEIDASRVDLAAIRRAVASAGYSVPDETGVGQQIRRDVSRRALTLFGLAVGIVLVVAVLGEDLRLLDLASDRVPWTVWALAVVAGGFPIFRDVTRAAARGRVISHTLMTVGVLAASVVGQWPTALIVVFFMRIGSYVEHVTTERGRQALRDLTCLAPVLARVERDGLEREVSLAEVQVGETVIVRPGEKIPVDGVIVGGQATVDQSAITGESMPVDVGPGATVFAASLASLGSLRVRVTRVGAETTFGRVIKLVQEAEANRGDVQRLADRFAGYYLPVVAAVATLTFLARHDVLAAAAVLVVACSCAFALATPIAILASIGAGAKRGILIKGGRFLEMLARADVLLIDKTGTITVGRPRIIDVVSLDGTSEDEVLALAAAAERDSEHPLAEAVRVAARERGLVPGVPREFVATPGRGVRAWVEGHEVQVGSSRLVTAAHARQRASELESNGTTVLSVVRDGVPIGLLAAADTVRPEVVEALETVRRLGISQIQVLTGDRDRVAAIVAARLGVEYRADLLPEEKIAIVKAYQSAGHTVVMVGDGVNDAPALAQADVGIAMGAAGTDVAIEAAHVVLLRDDWLLIPLLLRIARRTMSVVRLNIAFTIVYNVIGLSLAALGFLPPVLAAAAQSLPDVGILANSARLLRDDAPSR